MRGGGISASQQFGYNQTDVFAVSGNNQLNVITALGDGHWQGPITIGPALTFSEGSTPAVCQRSGFNHTEVFLIDGQGALNVLWVEDQGQWQGPQRISAVGFNSTTIPNGLVSAPAASPRFGAANQTDVFAVDSSGQLHVFSIVGNGSWSAGEKIGPPSFFYSPKPAVSQRFGVSGQTDVFVVDQTGQLNVFSATGAGPWSGPEKIGPAGVFPQDCSVAVSQQIGIADQTDVFLIDKNGQLNVFWANGNGAWQGPQKIGPSQILPAGGCLAASPQFGSPNQTDVFVVDNAGQLNVFSVVGEGQWQGPLKIGTTAEFPGGSPIAVSQQFGLSNQTNLFLVDNDGDLVTFTLDSPGAWEGPTLLNQPAGVPDDGLGSNSNYIFANNLDHNCAAIIDLTIDIVLTEDIVCASASGSTNPPNTSGYGFQLNCYSPSDKLSAWQQYVMSVWYSGGNPLLPEAALVCAIDNWPVTGPNIINDFFSTAFLPPNGLLAGYSLRITLQNDTNTGNITGATYQAWDNDGRPLCNVTRTLLETGQLTLQKFAPIIAFELNLVGPVDSETVVLSSGAGRITYTSSSTLVPLPKEPGCAESGYVTAEKANTFYSTVLSDPSTSFSQTFSVSASKPQIHRVGKARPGLSGPPLAKMPHITS